MSTVEAGNRRSSPLSNYSILLAMVLMGVISSLVADGFSSPANLVNVALQVSVNGILAVGMTMIILTGGIDLGVGSVLALVGVVAAKMQLGGTGTVLSILLSLLLGVLLGAWNGVFITRFSLPSFIVTLGTMTITRGLALVISGGRAIAPVNDNFARIANYDIPRPVSIALVALALAYFLYRQFREGGWGRTRVGAFDLSKLVGLVFALAGAGLVSWILLSPSVQVIPAPVAVFAVTAIVGSFTLTRTRFGRYLYAIGGNANAARLSGIDVKRILVYAYTVMGVLTALAALVLASRMAAGVPTAGNMAEWTLSPR